MKRKGDEVHINTLEASGGDKDRRLGKMLMIGTVLAIGLLTVVWITGAVRFDQANPVQAEASSAP
jgi:hypothetical protein